MVNEGQQALTDLCTGQAVTTHDELRASLSTKLARECPTTPGTAAERT